MTGMLKTVLRDMRILRGFLIGLGRAMASCAESSDNVNGIANVFVSAIRIIGQRKLLCICINSYASRLLRINSYSCGSLNIGTRVKIE